MGSAPIGPLLLSCSVPMMISMLVQALYNIMNDEIPDLDTRERMNQVTMAELQSREISLDTKGKFPTRL